MEGPHPVDVLNVPYFEFVEREEASVKRVDRLARRARGEPGRRLRRGRARPPTSAEILSGRGLAAANLAGGMVGLGARHDDAPDRRGAAPCASGRCSASAGGASRTSWRGREDAIVVDPHRGLDDYRALLERERLRLRAVFDTHLHADHVSGGPALARDAGVGLPREPADFEGAADAHRGAGGRPRPCGSASSRSCPSSRSARRATRPAAPRSSSRDALLLTGDTLFVDDVGRPDLGGQAAAWARELHRTLHERLEPLGDAGRRAAGPRERPRRRGPGRRRHRHARRPPAPEPGDAARPRRVRPRGRARGRLGASRVRAGSGRSTWAARRAAETELTELELGKNQCALSRR